MKGVIALYSVLKSNQHAMRELFEFMSKRLQKLNENEKRTHDHVMAQKGGSTSVHVGDHPHDDGTFAAFDCRR